MKKFYNTAVSLLQKESVEPKSPFYQAPLYPYFLSFFFKMFGNDYFNFLILQSIIGSLSVSIIFFLGNLMFEIKTGILAAALSIFYGPFIFYEAILLRVTLIIFLTLLFLLTLLIASESKKKILWFYSGILFGVYAIARANVLVLIPLICIYIYLNPKGNYNWRKIVNCVLLFIFGTCLIILPITIRNYIVGKKIVLISSNGPVTWAIGNSYDSTGFHIDPQKPLIPVKSIDFWKLQYKKFKLFWGDYEIPNNVNYYLFKKYCRILGIVPFFSFKLFLSLGIGGLILTFKDWKRYWLFYGFLFLFSFSIIIFHCVSRFRQPVVPILILFSAFFIHWIFKKIKQKNYLVSICYLAGVFIIYILLITPKNHIYIQPNHHLNLGSMFAVNKSYVKAINEEMVALNDKKWIMSRWLPVAEQLFKGGNSYKGFKILEKLLKIDLKNYNLRKDIAMTYEKNGYFKQALLHFNSYLNEIDNEMERSKVKDKIIELKSIIDLD